MEGWFGSAQIEGLIERLWSFGEPGVPTVV